MSLGIAGLAGLVVVGCTTSPDDASLLGAFLQTLEQGGPVGWVGFALLYGVIALTALPVSSMQLTAGFLLGPWWGIALCIVLSNVWGFVGFLLARTWLRDRARGFLERSATLRALDSAVEERGISMVLLLRISPMSPYNVLTYALGATAVRPRDYVIGTLFGAILPISFYTVIGASVSDLAAVWSGEIETPGWQRAIGVVVTVVATLLVTWRVRRQLVEAGVG